MPSSIQFISQNWQAGLDSAKKNQKIIFLDAYTTWCAPCKAMNREVFTQPAVADYYNRHFVNVQLDMEKGVGMDVAAAYEIKAYPTYLFLLPDGKVVHRGVGYLQAQDFLDLGQTALNPEARLGALHERFAFGDRTPAFLKKYIQKLTTALDPKRLTITEIYLKTQSDWRKREHLELIYGMIESTQTPLYAFLLSHQDTFKSIFGKGEVEMKIQNLLSEVLYNEKHLPTLHTADSLIELTYPNQAKRLKLYYRLRYARMCGDREGYAQAAGAYFKKFDDNAEELNETAQTFYEVMEHPHHLKKATHWAKKALKKAALQQHYLTLAQLYLKQGDKKRAYQVLRRAIEQAKKVGDNDAEARTLLKECQAH